jgi:uroporphyrinogen-III synthase
VRILVTRPLPDGEAIARRLAAMGHQALLAPLLTVKFLEGPPLNLASVQAVLVTSANGVRALARRTSERGIAMYAVGPQTAEAAHQEGFLHVRNADGDALALAEAVSNSANPGAGTLLHAAGEDSGHALCEALAASGFTTSREILYRIEKASQLPAEAARALRKGEVDAALFAECAARDDLSTERLAAICISANTADSLKGMAFSEVRIAAAPNQDALLACL